jgi:hypothetical protein
MLRVHWTRAAEAGFQFLGQFWLGRISHDDGSHHRRPARMTVIKHFDQIVDVGLLEASDIVFLIDVAGGGPNHHQVFEQFRSLNCGKYADHRTHGMANEVDVLETQFVDDLDDILGITIQGAVARTRERRQVGLSRANVIEKNDREVAFEYRRDRTPHILIASVPMSEHDRPRSVTGNSDIVALNGGHEAFQAFRLR